MTFGAFVFPCAVPNYLTMKIRIIGLCATALLAAASASASSIIPSPAGSPYQFHLEAGLTYASGFDKVADQVEQNFGLERKSTWPIGLKVSGYVEHSSGLAAGLSFGPFMFIRVENRNGYHHYDNTQDSYIIPASFDVRFFLPTNGPITPYARVGVAYPFSGGDQIGSGKAGPVAALGVHLWENRLLSAGIEAGYDGSKVEVKGGYYHGPEDIRPVEFTFGVFVVF